MIAPTSFFGDYGCHVRILEEARFLQQRGNSVRIATYHNGGQVPGMHTCRTLPIPGRADYQVGSSRHKIALDMLLSALCLQTTLRRRPDVLHCHLHEGALIGSILSRIWRIPAIFDYQGSLTGEMVDHGFLAADGRMHRWTRKMEAWINKQPARILTSSTNAANLLQSEFDCAPERIVCAPDCVNTREFAPRPRDHEWQQQRAALGIPIDRTVVVYLGLLAPYQGTDCILESARHIVSERQDIHWLIGGYPNVERYQAMARKMGLEPFVTFTGRVPYAEAPELLAQGDIAVSPKLSKTEGAGKLLNYMAMGLPTVAFDTPVSHEYLGQDGVYAKTASSASLADRTVALADAPLRRQALGVSLRRRAELLFGWDLTGQVILDTYAELTAR